LKVTAILLASVISLGQSTDTAPKTPPSQKPMAASIASVADRQVYYAEAEIVPAAEVMPEEKFNFAPGGPGDFKDVRTFAMQVKHIANTNYLFWSAVLGEPPAIDTTQDNGPDSIKSKADILKYLKDSYALGHRAAKSLTVENYLDRVTVNANNAGPRLFWTTFAISHDYDHYGQIVEYLRMNGIVPPASRR